MTLQLRAIRQANGDEYAVRREHIPYILINSPARRRVISKDLCNINGLCEIGIVL